MAHSDPLRHACVFARDISSNEAVFGSKIKTLAQLLHSHYQVPDFVGISASYAESVASEKELKVSMELADSAISMLQADRFAVRSSAFVEDGSTESHAGEFLTMLDVAKQDLPAAIHAVVLDAKQKGHVTTLHPFSVIVQTFVAPERAGVIFTRDPISGRDAVIEWRDGIGSDVVGGAKVNRVFRNDDKGQPRESFPLMEELFRMARAIERHFDRPQDIEWAIKDEQIFILQSRAITTVDTVTYRLAQSIDEMFRQHSLYFFSREGIGESFPVARPLAVSLLRYLHRDDGPISSFYRSLGLSFAHHDVFSVIGRALYIDKITELKQFFPAYAYKPTTEGMTPVIGRFSGLWASIKNGVRLSRLTTPALGSLADRIDAHVIRVSEKEEITTQEGIDELDRAYRDIFEVNFYAEHAFRGAEKRSAMFPYPVSAMLPLFAHPTTYVQHLPLLQKRPMVGNSLNIADLSAFSSRRVDVLPSAEVKKWWDDQNAETQKDIASYMVDLFDLLSLRESGRVLTVALVSRLRAVLTHVHKGDDDALFDSDILEYIGKKREMSSHTLLDGADPARMPSYIATIPPMRTKRVIGVSPGVSSGVIVTDHTGPIEGPKILLVDRLTPDLAYALSSIAGIISSEGGVLSHMAIVAREAGIPVVVDPLARVRFSSGEHVRIDGGTGDITRL